MTAQPQVGGHYNWVLGFEDAVGHRVRSQYWQKTGTTKLAKNHQPGTSAIVHTMV